MDEDINSTYSPFKGSQFTKDFQRSGGLQKVVLEFPTSERAKEWWSSEMYAKAKEIRQRAAHTKMIIVEGI